MSDFIRKSTILAAPIDRVWNAIIDPEQFGSWFRVRLDGPFTPGQRTTGNMTYPGYEHARWESFTETVEPPHCLRFSWSHPADETAPDPQSDPRTLVEFLLEPVDGGTRLTITESGFDSMPADVRETAYRRNEGGWEIQVANITEHVLKSAQA